MGLSSGPTLKVTSGRGGTHMKLYYHLAVCVDAAGGTDLVTSEPPATPERVSGGATGAAADCHVVLDSAVGALTNEK